MVHKIINSLVIFLAMCFTCSIVSMQHNNRSESLFQHTKRSASEAVAGLRDGTSFIASTIGRNATASNCAIAVTPLVVAVLHQQLIIGEHWKTLAAVGLGVVAGKKACLYAWDAYSRMSDPQALNNIEKFKELLKNNHQRTQVIAKIGTINELLENYKGSGLAQFKASSRPDKEFKELSVLSAPALKNELEVENAKLASYKDEIKPLEQYWLTHTSFWKAFKIALHFNQNPISRCLFMEKPKTEDIEEIYLGLCSGLSHQALAAFAARELAQQPLPSRSDMYKD